MTPTVEVRWENLFATVRWLFLCPEVPSRGPVKDGSMTKSRSRTSTHVRNKAGARDIVRDAPKIGG